MWSVLHIDGRMFDGNAGGVRQMLREHTGCDRSAAELLAEATTARCAGPIRYVVVLPAASHGGESAGARAWQLRAVHEEEVRAM